MLADSRLEKLSKKGMEHVAAVAFRAKYAESNGMFEHASAGLVAEELIR
jgi:hypothetical protein